jgi:general secretion pathway protein D
VFTRTHNSRMIACVLLIALTGLSAGISAAGLPFPQDQPRQPLSEQERQKILERMLQQMQGKPGDGQPARNVPDAAPGAAPAPAAATPSIVQRAPLGSGQIQLSYDNAELYEFINQVADTLGITPIIIDPEVKGSVTIHSSAPMSREDVFPLFMMILKNNNAALVKEGDIYQIVPTSSALKRGVEIIDHLPPAAPARPASSAAAPAATPQRTAPAVPVQPPPAQAPGNVVPTPAGSNPAPKLATHVIHVEFVPVRDLIEPLKLFMTEGGVIMPYERTNMLIVTDYSDSVEKIVQLITLLDNNFLDPNLIEMVKIDYNKSADIVEDLKKVFGNGSKDSATGVNFASLDRINSIMVMANTKRALEEAKRWIEKLDLTTGRSVQTFVYTVENSTASNIAMILAALFGGGEGGSTAAAAGGGTAATSGGALTRGGLAGGAAAAGFGSGGTGGTGTTGSGSFSGGSFGGGGSGSQSGFAAGGGSQGMYGSGGYGSSGGYGGGGFGGGFGGFGGGQQLGPRLNQSTGVSSQVLLGGSFVGLQGVVRMVVDDINNSLIIQSSATDYQFLLETIRKMDVLPRQAIIDARIFEVDLTDTFSFGVSANLQAASSGNHLTTGAIDATTGALSANTFAFVGNTREILLALTALQQKTKVRILEAPSVLALDSTMARIVVGAEIPYPGTSFVAATGGATTSVQYRDTGISLIVIPRISASGSVTLDVAQEISAPGAPTTTGPTFSKTSVATTLSVKDGETVAIAGLIRNSDNEAKSGIPFLTSIPILGSLFGHTNRTATRTELLILITPHVIRTTERFNEMTQELKDSLRNVRKLVDQKDKEVLEDAQDARKDRVKQEDRKRPKQ